MSNTSHTHAPGQEARTPPSDNNTTATKRGFYAPEPTIPTVIIDIIGTDACFYKHDSRGMAPRIEYYRDGRDSFRRQDWSNGMLSRERKCEGLGWESRDPRDKHPLIRRPGDRTFKWHDRNYEQRYEIEVKQIIMELIHENGARSLAMLVLAEDGIVLQHDSNPGEFNYLAYWKHGIDRTQVFHVSPSKQPVERLSQMLYFQVDKLGNHNEVRIRIQIKAVPLITFPHKSQLIVRNVDYDGMSWLYGLDRRGEIESVRLEPGFSQQGGPGSRDVVTITYEDEGNWRMSGTRDYSYQPHERPGGFGNPSSHFLEYVIPGNSQGCEQGGRDRCVGRYSYGAIEFPSRYAYGKGGMTLNDPGADFGGRGAHGPRFVEFHGLDDDFMNYRPVVARTPFGRGGEKLMVELHSEWGAGGQSRMLHLAYRVMPGVDERELWGHDYGHYGGGYHGGYSGELDTNGTAADVEKGSPLLLWGGVSAGVVAVIAIVVVAFAVVTKRRRAKRGLAAGAQAAGEDHDDEGEEGQSAALLGAAEQRSEHAIVESEDEGELQLL